MKRPQCKFRQPIPGNGTGEEQEEEYLDHVIRHILWTWLARSSPPPDAWTRILQRLKSEIPLPTNCEEVPNGKV